MTVLMTALTATGSPAAGAGEEYMVGEPRVGIDPIG